jgi:hypothetical protein
VSPYACRLRCPASLLARRAISADLRICDVSSLHEQPKDRRKYLRVRVCGEVDVHGQSRVIWFDSVPGHHFMRHRLFLRKMKNTGEPIYAILPGRVIIRAGISTGLKLFVAAAVFEKRTV